MESMELANTFSSYSKRSGINILGLQVISSTFQTREKNGQDVGAVKMDLC